MNTSPIEPSNTRPMIEPRPEPTGYLVEPERKGYRPPKGKVRESDMTPLATQIQRVEQIEKRMKGIKEMETEFEKVKPKMHILKGRRY